MWIQKRQQRHYSSYFEICILIPNTVTVTYFRSIHCRFLSFYIPQLPVDWLTSLPLSLSLSLSHTHTHTHTHTANTHAPTTMQISHNKYEKLSWTIKLKRKNAIYSLQPVGLCIGLFSWKGKMPFTVYSLWGCISDSLAEKEKSHSQFTSCAHVVLRIVSKDILVHWMPATGRAA